MTIEELLKLGIEKLKNSKIEDYHLKIRMLLAFILNESREYLVSHYDEIVGKEKVKEFYLGIEKIKNHIPIQYITNHQEFFGLDFYVDDTVLIPQPDTELLVENVISIMKKNEKVLDLCTGSGAIGIAIKKNKPDSNVFVSDISHKALEIAKRNAVSNQVNISFIESDLFENIQEINFDIIVSNPPYIETHIINKLPKEVQNEPLLALDGGEDGLNFYKKIAKEANLYLKANGYLCLEIGYNQKESVNRILEQNHYELVLSLKDLGCNDRIVIAKKG